MRRRFRRGPGRAIALLIALVALVVGRLLSHQPVAAPEALAEGVYRIQRVVDGDTIELAGHQRVRLIGVDTPETVKPDHPVEPWGPEATAFTKNFLVGGSARLQFDRERVDRYGRLLAYVWVGERMLNEELVANGLARYEPNFHYSVAMKKRFYKAQRDAQQAHRGIWSNGASHRD